MHMGAYGCVAEAHAALLLHFVCTFSALVLHVFALSLHFIYNVVLEMTDLLANTIDN